MHEADIEKHIRISNKHLFSLAEEVFNHGKSFKVLVTGNSMYPFLRHEIDSVELERVDYKKIKISDAVLAVRDDGAYVLHRVFKKNDEVFYMIGDGQAYLDGPYKKDNLVAKVTAIYRRKKRISSDNRLLRFFVRLWMLLRPARIPLLSLGRKLRTAYYNRR